MARLTFFRIQWVLEESVCTFACTVECDDLRLIAVCAFVCSRTVAAASAVAEAGLAFCCGLIEIEPIIALTFVFDERRISFACKASSSCIHASLAVSIAFNAIGGIHGIFEVA